METLHGHLTPYNIRHGAEFAVAMAIVLVPVSYLFNSNLTIFHLTGHNT